MITFDASGALAAAVGPEHGIDERTFRDRLKSHGPLCREIADGKKRGDYPFALLPYGIDTAQRIIDDVGRMKGKFRNFVHVGIGGSALGAIALHQALAHPQYNILSERERDGWPRIFFLDNVDPEETSALLETIDVRETLFYIVTKSGETTETLATLLPILDRLKKAGANLREHLLAATDPTAGFLRSFVREEKIESYEIPPGVGGRFSALTPVGLVPAAYAGIDILKLLAGAAAVDAVCSSDDPSTNIALQHALLHVLLDREKGKRIPVLMPYAGRLKALAAWYVQLWAESLGKRIDVGPTPLASVGATDQHSLIQLVNEGPNDKIITFIEVERWPRDVAVPKVFDGKPSVDYLQGKTLSQILAAEKRGTEEALRTNGRPTCTVRIPEISPRSIGVLIHFYQMAVLYAGRLYGVDPFGQPGVELGKKMIYRRLGRTGA